MAANIAKIEDTIAPEAAAPAPEATRRDIAAPTNADSVAGASPARDLQARLEAEIYDDQKMSARSVTAMVLIVCLSTWVAGIFLYASL